MKTMFNLKIVNRIANNNYTLNKIMRDNHQYNSNKKTYNNPKKNR